MDVLAKGGLGAQGPPAMDCGSVWRVCWRAQGGVPMEGGPASPWLRRLVDDFKQAAALEDAEWLVSEVGKALLRLFVEADLSEAACRIDVVALRNARRWPSPAQVSGESITLPEEWR